jgi:hypothetical protein
MRERTSISIAKRTRGGTLIEAMVTVGVFSILLVLIFVVFKKGFLALEIANGRRDAQFSLNKAHIWLKRDLEKASSSEVDFKRVPMAGNGDAIWFLSAEDPSITDPDQTFVHHEETGEPVWQKNVLYYLVRPSDYQSVSNQKSASIDPDPEGDFFAPHKFLIRKEIDLVAGNTSDNPEPLLSQSEIDQYITAPTDYTLEPFATEAGVIDYKLIADKLLSFQVEQNASAMEVTLSALRLGEARTRVAIGTTSLKTHPLTQLRRERFLLRN